MDKFYFEEPSLYRKEEIIDYINEFVEFNSNINGVGGLDKILEGYTFEETLERTINMSNEEFARSKNRCPGKTFLLIRKNDDKIIGSISLRWNLRPNLLRFAGHIGYGIRPLERRKGYNKINLYLGLLEAKKIGLNKVMLGCSVNNLGSDKSIKDLGGVLERSEIDPSDNELTNVYWIDVENLINKYESKYSKYIETNKIIY